MGENTPAAADPSPAISQPAPAGPERANDAPRRGRRETPASLAFAIVLCVASWVPWSFRAAEAWEGSSVIGCSIVALWFLITFMGIYGCLRDLGVVPHLRPPWCDEHW